MTIAHPRRLRTERALPQALQEALRELPHAAPERAQLDELRQKLGLTAATLDEPVRALLTPDRRLKERRLRRTVVALVFFPVAATAAVGTVMNLREQKSLSAAAVASSATSPARSAQRPVVHASPPPADPSDLLAVPAPLDSVARVIELPHAAPSLAHSGAHAESGARTLEPKASVVTELELLQHANAALKGDPARALSLTAEHRQQFPSGNLAQEREVIAIKALVLLSDLAGARESLARFERAYPRSAHVLELRQSVH